MAKSKVIFIQEQVVHLSGNGFFLLNSKFKTGNRVFTI